MDTVKAYIPDAVWYNYETVSFLPLQELLLLISGMKKQPAKAGRTGCFLIRTSQTQSRKQDQLL